MLFEHNKLGEEIAYKHILQVRDSNRESRMSYYIRRYNIFKGIITDPKESGYDRALCKEFYPAGKGELDSEYDERMKVWVPMGTIILNRLVDLALKGNVEYRFDPIEEGKHEDIAQIATDAYSKTLAYNNWEQTSRDRLIETLAIGQISDWFDYRRHDPKTGEQYDYGGRIRFVKYWPWFAEPIVSPDNVTEIIGAALIYNQEDAVISNAVSLQMDLSGKRKLITKMWIDPSFDTDTGAEKSKGCYARFENESLAMPDGREDWRNENKYGLTPVQFWQSPDIDESQYNGESFFDRFIDMWIKLCRTAANELSAIQYIINQMYLIAAKDATPKEIYVRHNITQKIPQGEPQAEFGVIERKLDLAPEKDMKQYLASTIGEAGGYSADLLSTDGAGKISESGIARKIVYEKTVDAVRSIRRNYASQKAEMMSKALRVLLYENDGKINGVKIDPNLLRPVVSFDDNIMPISDSEAFELNVRRRDEGVITEEQFIILENDDIKTRAQAEEHIARVRESRAANQPKQQTFIRRNARQN